MASYATIADVAAAAGGRERLRELSDDGRAGRVDEAAVQRAIAQAEAHAKTKVGFRYGDNGGPVPAALRDLVAAEAVFILRSERGSVTETDMELHKERLAMLRDIATGRATLGPAEMRSPDVVDAAAGGAKDITNRRRRWGIFS